MCVILGKIGLWGLEQVGSGSNTSELYLQRLHLVAGPGCRIFLHGFLCFSQSLRTKARDSQSMLGQISSPHYQNHYSVISLLIKKHTYKTKLKTTPTCFGTGCYPEESFYNKGIEVQHASLVTASPSAICSFPNIRHYTACNWIVFTNLQALWGG